jgi:hypothetical protein
MFVIHQADLLYEKAVIVHDNDALPIIRYVLVPTDVA